MISFFDIPVSKFELDATVIHAHNETHFLKRQTGFIFHACRRRLINC
jgi:hypothetical protein